MAPAGSVSGRASVTLPGALPRAPNAGNQIFGGFNLWQGAI